MKTKEFIRRGKRDVAKKSEEQEIREKYLIVNFLGLTMQVLHDEFGFGDARLKRFGQRVEEIFDCINADYVSFDDILEEKIKKYAIDLKGKEKAVSDIQDKIKKREDYIIYNHHRWDRPRLDKESQKLTDLAIKADELEYERKIAERKYENAGRKMIDIKRQMREEYKK